METKNSVMVGLIAIICVLGPCTGQGLKLGFYTTTCPKAEGIVLDVAKNHISLAPELAASLIRMHFHDCFVRGCDGSVLLNSSNGNAEKDAIPNQTLRGFSLIDKAKAAIEKQCPGVVSCADILALIARDAHLVAHGGPEWNVPTGRRDGRISNSSEALANIPFPTFNFSQLSASFASKGLNNKDLVLLSGAHTIGIAHCGPPFSNRLYNFSGKGDSDPSMDKNYVANLKKNKCKTPSDNTTIIEMDPGSFRTFDLSYYQRVKQRRGLFQSDAALLTDSASKSYIENQLLKSKNEFFTEFAKSMEKMGQIGVLTGSAGEIRRQCSLVN
ncbi:peroxidase 3 [Cryptomeria japonica]|uniref:peroxidase 3 n=1 Tax=Cryptomeria japonica TaxID=3369 RepID=UPI0027DA411C|nr:peroxidase 3 [Cryptomeria japonica]